MKKLKLSENDKMKLIKEFKASLDTYGDDSDDLKVKFEKDLNEKVEQKLQIVFTASAYLKSWELVKMFPGEVGWHGLMKKISDNAYLVYDILVMPQVVSGARAVDTTKTNEWYDKHEDEMEFMRFQAHSHVEMQTTPSTTDTDNQRNIVKNMASCGGFALFQIWNKRGDINSFFYDIDNNLLYDRNDIEIVVQTDGEFGTLKEFTNEAKALVGSMNPPLTVVRPTEYNSGGSSGYYSGYNSGYSSGYNSGYNAGYGYRYNSEYNPVDKPVSEKMKDPFYWQDETGKESYEDYEYGETYRWI